MRILLASLAGLILLAAPAAAADLIYRPINPGFGGNPNTFDYLIGMAQIQNQHVPQGGGGGGGAIPEINFPPITIDLGGVGGGLLADPGATTPAN
jgi:opacity protein-like surface antigen